MSDNELFLFVTGIDAVWCTIVYTWMYLHARLSEHSCIHVETDCMATENTVTLLTNMLTLDSEVQNFTVKSLYCSISSLVKVRIPAQLLDLSMFVQVKDT